MKKVFYLATCDTCKRILNELKLPPNFELIEIKKEGISKEDLERMKKLSGSYESLFSKRARLYRERDFKSQHLNEADFKNLILEHYTFLKRPVIIDDTTIFIGNSPKTITAAKNYFDHYYG